MESLLWQTSDEDFLVIKRQLRARLASEVKEIATRYEVKFAGINNKSELIACLLVMPHLGTIRCTEAPSNLCADVVCDGERPSLSYMMEDVKEKLRSLPVFDDVTELWTKDIGHSFGNFHFVDLHT